MPYSNHACVFGGRWAFGFFEIARLSLASKKHEIVLHAKRAHCIIWATVQCLWDWRKGNGVWNEQSHGTLCRRGEERRFKKSNNHTKSPPTLYRLGRLLHVFVLLLLPVLRPIAFIMWNLSNNILSFQSVHTWINDHKCCNFINTTLEVLHMFARISSRLSEQRLCGDVARHHKLW